MSSPTERPQLHVETAGRVYPNPSEQESGDRWVFQVFEEGALLAGLDGCGHGAEAAAAAELACAELRAHAGDGVLSLMERCHRRLRHSRGAAMTLASFHEPDSTLTWIGVGNVEAVLFRSAMPRREHLFLRNGVVGYRLPPLQAAVIPVCSGDTLIITTDGIRRNFASSVSLDDPPQRIADRICEKCATEEDDGMALVARFWCEDQSG